MKDTIRKRITESISVKEFLARDQALNIESAAKAIIGSLKTGGKLIVFGNGGSTADSQHIAGELVGRFKKERRPFAAIALGTNTPLLTAIANDYGYSETFSRELEALGKKGDVALAISTSGNSKNVLEAVKKAKAVGIRTIALAGCDGGMLKKECDISIVVASRDTPRIQESHIMIGHILCELIEEGLSK
ncbi:MAG: D-sedoheptulose 7-phosphate isomerase [Candidatus Omnitrophota bacterium]|jgi:D-sedoheptulose 7-phosphate isomerase